MKAAIARTAAPESWEPGPATTPNIQIWSYWLRSWEAKSKPVMSAVGSNPRWAVVTSMLTHHTGGTASVSSSAFSPKSEVPNEPPPSVTIRILMRHGRSSGGHHCSGTRLISRWRSRHSSKLVTDLSTGIYTSTLDSLTTGGTVCGS